MKKGFTLIELLVVVLIIGILAAIALPQYNLAVEKTRVTEAITVAHNLQKAIDIWLLSNGGYPSNVVDFLGDNTNGKGSLDIDVESTMDCSVESGTWCRSRDFQYKAACGIGVCWMYIHKMKPGTNSMLYAFEYTKNSHAQNTWQGGECDCSDGHPIGVKICQWLASQNVGHWVCNDC